MKCFFVGGPNIRKDYHIEEGPEVKTVVQSQQMGDQYIDHVVACTKVT